MDFEKLLEEAAGKKLAGKKKQLQSSYDQSLADLAELEQGAAQQAREAATRRTAEAKQPRGSPPAPRARRCWPWTTSSGGT
ncbi:MAG: hypothetical protein BHW33_00570 [Firmicutes bacterium CAG:137_57_8]|nr:MAG: hypothetical protein BHW33_00570 [Firmicutes bacterium CAG:137_57_8]